MKIKLKLIIFSAVILLIALSLGLWINNRAVHYYWTNNYTETSGLKNLAKSMHEIQKIMDGTIKLSKKHGHNYKVLYQSAYGSGFIQNNPIPNDLDYDVVVDLGEFDFDGIHTQKLAHKIMRSIEYFNLNMNEYTWTKSKHLYVVKTGRELISYYNYRHKQLADSLAQSIPYALSGKEYHKHTIKSGDTDKEFDFSYLLNPGEMVLEDYRPVLMYGDNIKYYDFQQDYMRELSIVVCYVAHINYNGKLYTVEMFPESLFTERLNLQNRFYASNIFVGNGIYDYISNLPVIADTKTNVKYRLWAIGRHLDCIVYFQPYEKKPIKYVKRMKQLKDMLGPLLDEESQKEIDEIVYKNLHNRDVELLNEVKNICANWMTSSRFFNFYQRVNNYGLIKKMDKILTKTVDELEERGNIDKKTIKTIRAYQKDMEALLEPSTSHKFNQARKEVFGERYDEFVLLLNESLKTVLTDIDRLHELQKRCFKIVNDAGIYTIRAVWLDKETIGLIRNEFTDNVKDVNDFVKVNNLPEGKYVMINPNQMPPIETTIDRRFWVRYKSTPEQDKRYDEIINIMIKDKKNYDLKQKTIYFY